MVTNREQQRIDTARAVLTAAEQLFLERGFAETTIRDIAEVAGVSVGTVMTAGDKNALLLEVFDRTIEGVHLGRAGAIRPPKNAACADHIMRLLDPFLALFTGRSALARQYASILVAGGHQSRVFTELAQLLTAEITAVLRGAECAGGGSGRGGSGGIVSEQRAAALAEAVYFAYIGRLFTWPTALDGDAGSLGVQLRDTIATICNCEGPRS